MSEAVVVSQLRKEYPLPGEPKSLVGGFLRARILTARKVQALKGIDFAIHQGESVALLGRNGSGKSTLLRLVAGVTSPTRGTVLTNGRIAAVLGLGAGFHPELTGRENLFMNAVLHGLSLAATRDLCESIVAFADIGEFMDAPLRAYSDGMMARLGVSIALHLPFDLLVFDEALSAGDFGFVAKCRARIAEVRSSGAVTFLFATHGLDEARDFATRAIVLEGGLVKADGPAREVTDRYAAGSL